MLSTSKVSNTNERNLDSDEITRKLGGLENRIERIDRKPKIDPVSSKAPAKLNGMVASLGKLAIAYASVETAARLAGSTINAGIASQTQQQRLKLLSDGYDNYADVLNRANAAGQRFNQSQIEAQQGFAQLYGRLRPLGLNLDEITAAYEGFNTAARLAGSSSAESAGAMLQLSQALGAGALRGEEFNSVMEQAPGVAVALGKELGVPVGALKELASQGVITSDVVINALTRIRDEGTDKLAASMDTPEQKIKLLQSSFSDLQVEVVTGSMPAIIGVVKNATNVIEGAREEVKIWQRCLEGASRLS